MERENSETSTWEMNHNKREEKVEREFSEAIWRIERKKNE